MNIIKEPTYKVTTEDFLKKVSEWLTEETKTCVIIKDFDFEYNEALKSQMIVFITAKP